MKTENRDESFHLIPPDKMTTWKILIRCYLETKGCLSAIKKDKPALDPKQLLWLMRGRPITEKAAAYKNLVKRCIRSYHYSLFNTTNTAPILLILKFYYQHNYYIHNNKYLDKTEVMKEDELKRMRNNQ